jgi:hypothetical protein
VLAVRFDSSPINDYVWTGLARAMGGAAGGVRERLHAELGWIVDVWPVVVIVGYFPLKVVSSGRLAYVSVDELAGWLKRQPQRLALQDRPAVAAAVGGLPPAGDIAPNDSVDLARA